MKRISLFIVLALLLCATASAAPVLPAADATEVEWINYVAATFERNADVEADQRHLLADGSRVDVLERVSIPGLQFTHAWSVAFAGKSGDAVEQALFCQSMTNADSAGVVLICVDPSNDRAPILRCAMACQRSGLRLAIVRPNGGLTYFPTETPQRLASLLVETIHEAKR